MPATTARDPAGAVPSVSVVIPTKNRRSLLMPTLAAVAGQSDVELEVVVVDDGSTDGTVDAVGALGDPRITVLRHETSRGVVAARNRGLAGARGEWVAFCDDDDLWAPGKLASQLHAAAALGRRWAVAGAVGFEPDGNVLYERLPVEGEQLAALLPWNNAVPGGSSNVVARRSLLDEVGGFDPRLRVLADWELWIRLARSGPPASVPAAAVGYRMHGANMSTGSEGVLDELRLIEGLSADLRNGRRLDPAWFHKWMGVSMMRGGNRRGAALAFWRQATVRKPSPVLRSVACLVVPAPGWAIARRLRRGRVAAVPTPPWLAYLLAAEHRRLVAAG